MSEYINKLLDSKDGTKISKPGEYKGWTKTVYNGYKRFSQYVSVSDGTKLAVDYYRPTMDGKLVEQPLPVIWRFTPYGRIHKIDGKLVPQTSFGSFTVDELGCGEAEAIDISLKLFCGCGYVVGIADVRGLCGSYGNRVCGNQIVEGKDGRDINEWFAKQSWCTGKTGMFGSSYNGQTVMGTIRERPEHLCAAVVSMTDYNKYDGWVRGGIARGAGNSDLADPAPIIRDEAFRVNPVDGDIDNMMLNEAVSQHSNPPLTPLDENSPQVMNYWKKARLPFRDSWSEAVDCRYWEAVSASTYKQQINDSGVAMYLVGGWFDLFPREVVLMYQNLTTPKKMIIGPWLHAGTRRKTVSSDIEHLRFFDYWLKGINNGVMEEPPIYMIAATNENEGEWNFENEWPVKETNTRNLFLRGDRSGSALSQNDGSLKIENETSIGTKDLYTSVYGIGIADEPEIRPNTSDIDQYGLTYTTEIFEADTHVVGHPLLNLWISSTSQDVDFYATLVDVDENGKGMYVTEGHLRASMRDTAQPPYDFLGLPWHPCKESDVHKLVPGKPVLLEIDLQPTSFIFKKGHRLRLTITNAMRGFFYWREDVPPTVSVYRDAINVSYISLPISAK